ncbi:interleukin 17 receptor A1a [Gadus chalcogrammus]|uniref:interleukin 17 receptor A1a n=1 Tax=Gadus chalcogrammus TaxID=1042646 RepID=UPI0024C279CE|nr:interleukin 17 receptor A1a [Gadus chalcogrammus]
MRRYLVLIFLHASLGLRIVPGSSSDCSQQGLGCKVHINNCIGRRLSDRTEYIPAAPEGLDARWETREDEKGNVFPVVHARWNMVDDGSISFLNGTELHVLVRDTNQDLCVRYSFSQRLTSRNPDGEKWSFSVSTVMVDPGQTYLVSVFNIPKPEPLHSSYKVHKEITVPGCQDPVLKKSKFCVERGSLWSPNVTEVFDAHTLSVGFSTDRLAEKYSVIAECEGRYQRQIAYMNKMASLNVTFNMKDWPLSCCQMTVEIQPYFPECWNDCGRRRKNFSICGVTPTSSPVPFAPYSWIGFGLIFLCVVIACICIYVIRKPKKFDPSDDHLTSRPIKEERLRLDLQPPKLLVIYSQDHPLYRSVVLNLCAFLKSKCGTDVLVDLLDATMVGTVGTTRWLEWQRRQLQHPLDKILILCSRGVQAKWRAMCGEERVLLREDVLSPNDDMLVPFLNLFLPNMHQPAALGKYIVAYFEDVSDERDVPSVFDIAVKYRLMKHFEELYFRVLEMEKYQPGCVNHIEGIGKEEYFTCPSGCALRDAIRTFKAFQTENPDWFEAQCVASEEDAVARQNLLNRLPDIPPVLECVPLIRDGTPVYINEALVQSATSVYVLTPELNNHNSGRPSVAAVEPRVNPPSLDPYRVNAPLVNRPHGVVRQQCPHGRDTEEGRMLLAVPSLNQPPLQVCRQWHSVRQDAAGRSPVEDDEEEDEEEEQEDEEEHEEQEEGTLVSCPGPGTGQGPTEPQYPSRSDIENLRQLQLLLGGSHPVEVGENELLLGPSAKGPSTGSDQGYISKEPSRRSQPEPETDPLVALARLQQELFQTALT